MLDVLLVECPSIRKPALLFESLTLGCLSSFLRSRGFSVEILDAMRFPKDRREIVNEIEKRRCRLVGFTVRIDNLSNTQEITRLLRNRNKTINITLGGHEATCSYYNILTQCPEVDCIVIGEGEYTLLELVERIRDEAEWHSISGIAYRNEEGQIVHTSPRPLIHDLDSLPCADRSAYESSIRQSRSANVYTSRGCYGDCSYCGINFFYGLAPGPKWRMRSAKNVVDEIEILVRDFGVGHIFFADDEFVGPGKKGKRRALDLVQELTSRNLRVDYNIVCRPDNVDHDLMTSMKESGLFKVDIGIESWVPRQLELYRKFTTPQDNDKAIAILNELGLDYFIFLIPFDPYVSVEELLCNIEAVLAIGIEHFQMQLIFNRVEIKKHMALYQKVLADGLITGAEEQGASGYTANYSFKNAHIQWLYDCATKLARAHYDTFNPIHENITANISTSLSPIKYFESVKVASKKWVVERYRDILYMVKNGEVKSANVLMEINQKEYCAKLSTIREEFSKASRENFQEPLRVKIGDEVLHFNPERREIFKPMVFSSTTKISNEEIEAVYRRLSRESIPFLVEISEAAPVTG